MKEVPYMYRLKPICGLNTRVELPKCMYRLRQIQGSLDPTDIMHDNILAKSSFIEEQENHPAVKTLEQRQEAILGQLRNLKRLVEELSRQLKIPSSSPQAEHVCMNNRFQEVGEVLQVVVKASPSRLPYALLAAVRVWCPPEDDSKKANGKLEVKWYVHSSVSGAVPSLPCGSNKEKSKPRVHLTFIWKDVVPGVVEFSVGNSLSWLRGEAVLMSLLMLYLPSSAVIKKASVVSEVALSALLDSCTAATLLTESSSSANLKKTLSEVWRWASSPDLIPSAVHSISVGEIVLWGALKGLCRQNNKEPLPSETPNKLVAWFASYSKFLGY